MNSIKIAISKILHKKEDKKNELYSIFKEYVAVSRNINSLKEKERNLEISRIKNQINEYYISIEDLALFIDVDKLSSSEALSKIKHISEINPKLFTFAELYVTPKEEGILLSPTKSSTSECVRIVSYKKVN